jgi:hypothetical protein
MKKTRFTAEPRGALTTVFESGSTRLRRAWFAGLRGEVRWPA